MASGHRGHPAPPEPEYLLRLTRSQRAVLLRALGDARALWEEASRTCAPGAAADLRAAAAELDAVVRRI